MPNSTHLPKTITSSIKVTIQLQLRSSSRKSNEVSITYIGQLILSGICLLDGLFHCILRNKCIIPYRRKIACGCNVVADFVEVEQLIIFIVGFCFVPHYKANVHKKVFCWQYYCEVIDY